MQKSKNVKEFNSLLLINEKQNVLFYYLTEIYSIFKKQYMNLELKM